MRLFIGTMSLVTMSAFSVTNAQAEHRYDREMHSLATAIERAADEVKHEVDLHFRHRHDYARLRAISRVIETKADHIERIVDRHESPEHIYADLAEIDRNVHAFEDIVQASDRHARDYHGERRHVKTHVHEELHRLTDLIHEMRDHMDHAPRQVHVRRPVVHQPRPVVVRHHDSRGGVTFGGHWGRVHVRF